MRELAHHLLEFASSDWGPIVMVAHAFFESFILPLAHELFLIPVSIARPHLSFVFAFMSTIASLCGMSVGYLIGRMGGRPILKRFVKPELLEMAEKHIRQYDVWAAAIACFTPVPVKVFVLVAGSVKVNYRRMIVVAFFARGARFFLTSLLLYIFGEPIKEFILAYMNWMMIILFVVSVVFILAWNQVQKFILARVEQNSSKQ